MIIMSKQAHKKCINRCHVSSCAQHTIKKKGNPTTRGAARQGRSKTRRFLIDDREHGAMDFERPEVRKSISEHPKQVSATKVTHAGREGGARFGFKADWLYPRTGLPTHVGWRLRSINVSECRVTRTRRPPGWLREVTIRPLASFSCSLKGQGTTTPDRGLSRKPFGWFPIEFFFFKFPSLTTGVSLPEGRG
ncbi:uncharacterized protein BO66DRAFT_22573 [Aspergillus aculeatinus CBS 121060]|uniref:Uncharacterized protein n=1 Tax=Aspergillus aculeatinus CBS 121060 TaxID=1448322 RepID=A0ACD1GQW0_9EURO|nr:hypothetical protein BO66DRAFT_22573 [Aspergillus aculeatinus CBS 121060]RAH63805.1 hypothetical protein BO66DRAFT_22573 [Aspergillus aculeatinus CBS 121060]